MTRNLLVIGQSHVGAIRAAARARREADPQAPRTRTIHSGEARFAPELVDGPDGPAYAPPLAAEIDDQIARHAPLVASCIGGNVHNVLALMRHPRPFDFRLPGESDALDPAAEPIAFALVEAALAAAMARDLIRFRLLAARVPGLVHLQSPPPLADNRRIAEQADAFFRTRAIGAGDVAPPALRRRMWLLQSRIMRAACDAAGATFLDVPDAVLDGDGFLGAAFAGDATHGNQAYGEAWIAKLERL